MKVYVIGSLRNPKVIEVANQIRAKGFDVFDDWMAAGPEADDKWKEYETARGRTYEEALKGYAAHHVYSYDRHHLEESDVVVLVCPAGKSGFLELGWALGQGKRGYILLEAANVRWDVMFLFADGVFSSLDLLMEAL